MPILILAAVLLSLVRPGISPVAAQDVDSFYRGKQLRLIVGSDPGGGYDAYGRLLAAHLGRHIPGQPSILVQNMPGAGSLAAANHVLNVAPKDGSTIGAIQDAAILAPFFHPEQAKFDLRRVAWLGSIVSVTYTIIASERVRLNSFADLFETELLMAASGGASASATLPLITNAVLGTKLKVIQGYASSSATMLAISRGEADGRVIALGSLLSLHEEDLRTGRLRILASYGLRPVPELAGVPLVIDYAPSEIHRQKLAVALSPHAFGWPYLAPADVPPARLAALRAAFAATMEDPAFRAEAAARKLEVSPVSWEAQNEQVERLSSTPADILADVRRMLGQ